MNSSFFFILFAYFILLLSISFLFSRKLRNLEDFFLAGRNLSGFLVFFSLAASWIGATSILVSIDEAYRRGIGSFWVMGIPAVLTVLIFAFLLLRPIRTLPFVSLPDLVEIRYGPTVRHISAFLIVWYMIVLAASQMTALGKFFEAVLGTSYLTALLLGTAVVLIYSVFGGFFSVVVTDGLQFFLLAAGLIGLLFFLIGRFSLTEAASLADSLGRPGYFDLFSEWKNDLLMVLSFTCAWIISPIAWQRIQAAKSTRHARTGLLASAGTFGLLFGVIVLSGILLLPRFPSGLQEGPLLSVLISAREGGILSVILFIAITAAVMSTMDTAVNTGALSMTRDIFQRMLGGRTESGIAAGRISTLLVGFLAVLIAIRPGSILRILGLASEIMTAGFFIPGVAMLFLKKKLPTAGLLAVLFGGGFALTGFMTAMGVLSISWPKWPNSVLPGLGLSLAGFLAGAGIDAYRRGRG